MILLRINLFTNYPSNQDIKPKKISNDNKEKNENNIVKKKVTEDKVPETDTVNHSLDSLKKFISSQDIQGLMLDLSQNSIIESNNKCTKLIIDESKKNTYPKKCVDDFITLIIDYFKVTNELIVEYSNDIFTLYKQSVNEKLKSQDDMYNSIKDNTLIKEIEDVFDAKIDKENISKLWWGISMGMFDKMKEAKNMYSNIKKAQNEINKIKVEGTAGAGAVSVTVKGNHQIVSIKIDDDTQKGNKKILEDYLVAACNDAMNKLEKETKDKMGSVMNLPGGMKLPF